MPPHWLTFHSGGTENDSMFEKPRHKTAILQGRAVGCVSDIIWFCIFARGGAITPLPVRESNVFLHPPDAMTTTGATLNNHSGFARVLLCTTNRCDH